MAARQFFTPRNKDLAKSEVGIFMTKEDPYGVGAVSSGEGDKGGPSFGTFQMPSVPFTKGGKAKVSLFVEQLPSSLSMRFKDRAGKFYSPQSEEFKKGWRDTAKENNLLFGQAQEKYIYKGGKDSVGIEDYLNKFEDITGKKMESLSPLGKDQVEGTYNHMGHLGHGHARVAKELEEKAKKNNKPFSEEDFFQAFIKSKLNLLEKNFIGSKDDWPGLRNRFNRELSKFSPRVDTPNTSSATEMASGYMIKKGDTLSGIARKHGVSVADLQKVNNIKGDRIRAGDSLSIPSLTDPPKPPKKILPEAGIQHQIQQGDTLYDLARKYGTTVESLQKLNKIKGSKIRSGDIIQIPEPSQKPKKVSPEVSFIDSIEERLT